MLAALTAGWLKAGAFTTILLMSVLVSAAAGVPVAGTVVATASVPDVVGSGVGSNPLFIASQPASEAPAKLSAMSVWRTLTDFVILLFCTFAHVRSLEAQL